MGSLTPIEKDLIELRPTLEELVPEGMSVDRFIKISATAVLNTYNIGQASQQSVLSAIQKCAQDGLVPDGREAAFVVAKGQCQYRPMVYGIVKRAGDIAGITISTNVVKDGDFFEVELGDTEKLTHKRIMDGTDRNTVAVYAIFKDASGRVLHREVMERWEIDKARQVAATQKVWTNWFDEMARKTVIHRGAKYVAMSEQVSSIVRRLEDDTDFSRLDRIKDVSPASDVVSSKQIADASAYEKTQVPVIALSEMREELSVLVGCCRMPSGSSRCRDRLGSLKVESPLMYSKLINWKGLKSFVERNVQIGEKRRVQSDAVTINENGDTVE